MERREGNGMFVGLGLVFFIIVGNPSAVAADGDGVVAEAVPSQTDAGLEHATRDQILQTIDATRQTDPELATEMERQLHLMESGDATLPSLERDLQGRTPSGEATSGEVFGVRGGTGKPELIGPPVETSGGFEQVQADPRMQEIRQQFEGGQLSENQAREKMFEVLRDHGVEPNNGHEWERQGEQGEHGEGRWDHQGEQGQQGERGQQREGFERAFERMSSEGREHAESMERMFEHEGERPEALRETSERETPTRESDRLERMPEGSEPSHEYDTPPQH